MIGGNFGAAACSSRSGGEGGEVFALEEVERAVGCCGGGGDGGEKESSSWHCLLLLRGVTGEEMENVRAAIREGFVQSLANKSWRKMMMRMMQLYR